MGVKYYFEDMGISNMIRGGDISSEIHKLIENAVFLHLTQSGYKVFVGRMNDKEIDFMADKNGRKIYIQVTLTAMDEKTRTREFGNLMEIMDNYPKYVIALNDIIIGDDYKGITYCNLADFLVMDI